jgi:hypothetical protein
MLLVRGSKGLCLRVSQVLLWEFIVTLIVEIVNQSVIVLIYKVKQSRYRPGVAQRVPGS